MRILFLSRWYPFPPNNGSKLRIYNLLRFLGQSHAVTLVSFYDPDEGIIQEPVPPFCKEVYSLPWKEFRPTHWKALLGFFHPHPRWVVDTYSKEMARLVNDQIEKHSFDVIIASQTIMAPYVRKIQGIPKVLEEAEVGVFIQKAKKSPGTLGKFRYSLTWLKYQEYLRRLFRDFDIITVVSEEEKSHVLPLTKRPEKVEVIPNGVKVKDYEDIVRNPVPNTIIFTGSFRYSANYEAMTWFVSQVFPLIQAKIPDIRLIITGDSAGKHLPFNPQVTQTGKVPDVREWIASSWVAIAPLQTGGGTRLKILEAMALCTPVVSTSKGAEGLDAISSKHLIIADSPNEFAKAVIDICRDSALREEIATSAFDLIKDKYDWDSILPRYQEILEGITSPKVRERG